MQHLSEASLVDLAQRFATARSISLWRLGFLAAGDGKYFVRLQRGGSSTLRVTRQVVQYLSDEWPSENLEWPEHIPRPAPRPANEPEAAAEQMSCSEESSRRGHERI